MTSRSRVCSSLPAATATDAQSENGEIRFSPRMSAILKNIHDFSHQNPRFEVQMFPCNIQDKATISLM